ncbi:hypothetical protein Pmani_034531 [Petrolisthes manimaculis]|uniref:BPTI/Kunitz inhibitor domain-containing protein n=1 Tax=Petrolisthes manimaculis TaxID=1843537 RepID=A0AAE1NM90_9EUCA|nr:hypothetical protein Pmani_034531 [Petrolisthes manimaculis]
MVVEMTLTIQQQQLSDQQPSLLLYTTEMTMSLIRSGVVLMVVAAMVVVMTTEALPWVIHSNHLQPESTFSYRSMLHKPVIPSPAFIVSVMASEPSRSSGDGVLSPRPLRSTGEGSDSSQRGGQVGSPQPGSPQPSSFQPSRAQSHHLPTPTHAPTTTTTLAFAPFPGHEIVPAPFPGHDTVPVPASPQPTSTPGKYRDPQCGVMPDPGECRGAFPRYFFNTTTNQCDCFLYGGCPFEGLQSSYKSLDECIGHCSPENTEEGPKCRHIFRDDVKIFDFHVKPQEPVVRPQGGANSGQGPKQPPLGHHQNQPVRPGTVGGVPFPDTSIFSDHELFDMLSRSTKEDTRSQQNFWTV